MIFKQGLRGLKSEKAQYPGIDTLSQFIDHFFVRPTYLMDISIEDLTALIQDFHTRHDGEYPNPNTTEPAVYQGKDYKWTGISATINGRRGKLGEALMAYPNVVGLGSFIDEFCERALTVEKIRSALERYYQDHKTYPVSGDEGDASPYIGLSLSWKNIHERIRDVRVRETPLSRELAAYQDILSLAGFIDHFFDRRLNVANIKTGVIAYYNDHGRVPTNRDGDASTYFKDKYSWEAVRLSINQRIGPLKEELANQPDVKGIRSFIDVLMPDFAGARPLKPKAPRP